MDARFVLGIDLGGTNLKLGLFDAAFRVVQSANLPTDATRGPQHFVDCVANFFEQCCADKARRQEIVAAGVGTPGPLHLRTGTILKAANLPGWVNVPLRDLLSARLNLPVVIENDANAAAYGEYRCTAGASRNMVLLTLGTGVGSGVILDGQILHGHFDNAGELGHMIVAPDGLSCACGQRGCLEAYASAGALVRRFEQGLDDEGRAEFLAKPLDAQIIVEAAGRRHPLALRLWDQACYYLAIACINIQHAYNPQVVLLGGGLAEAGEFLLSTLRGHLKANRWKLHDDFPSIEQARLRGNAGMMGAAALAWDLVATSGGTKP